MNIYAEKIKEAITMFDVAECYGFEPDRSKKISCPFHSEKTSSFRLYDSNRGYYCFGCGQGGDVIDFVRKFFNLDFTQALSKINNDFGLNLPLNRQLTLREQKQSQQELIKRREERKRISDERERRQSEFNALNDEWARLDINRRKYAPKMSDESLHPLFVESLYRLTIIEYRIDCFVR